MHRNPTLDGYRAVSIILVLAAHLLPLGPKILQLNAAVAALGMTMFFSLSGFLISSQLLKNPNVRNFMIRRIARIWPLVIIYTLIVYMILHPDFSNLIFTNTFTINYFTQYMDSWNGHLWSLCVEMQFYVGIAVAVLAGGRKAVFLVWPACLLVTSLRIYDGALIDNMTHLRVDEILIGSALATVQVHWISRRSSALWIPPALGLTLFASSPFFRLVSVC